MALKKSYSAKEIRGALRKVRTKLRNGKIGAKHFDMADYMTACGTVGCIGGWAALELGVRPQSAGLAVLRFASADQKLDELFFSKGKATPKQGAQAIENYLAGKPAWSAA